MYKALPSYLHVKDSPVSGQGLFAIQDIPDNMYLGISHVVVDDSIMRTPLGGFVNMAEVKDGSVENLCRVLKPGRR